MKARGMRDAGKTKKWFDRWANKYDQTLGRIGFHRALLDLAVKSSGVKDGDRVLDVGCGTGLLSLRFLGAADCTLTCIDNSKEMLAIFREKVKRLGLEGRVDCRRMDARAIDLENGAFDIAASTVVLHHLKEKAGPLKKICKALKPGGVFIVGEFDVDSTGPHANIGRLKRILAALEEEWVCALEDVGIEAFAKMYENGLKHVLNDGEYCLSLKQWAAACRKAGFRSVAIKRVPSYAHFGIVVARKGASIPAPSGDGKV
jgi:ubiquinone/menaquinone biosynthesis C-methylase UbiE